MSLYGGGPLTCSEGALMRLRWRTEGLRWRLRRVRDVLGALTRWASPNGPSSRLRSRE
jgi:hypothetical protein